MNKAITKVAPKWPVIEVFGPTVQGEGVDQGVAAHFVRFGGCDFKCDWCDTPYAVLPAEVRKNATRMDANRILAELDRLALDADTPWIVLTGGNPALHDLSSLVEALHEEGYLVAVETQGSKWREWMANLDRVCVSPKPPSAKQDYDFQIVQRFLEEGLHARAQGERDYQWLFLKVPIFDEKDLDWVEGLRAQCSDALLYLSAGNDAGRTVGNPKRKDSRSLNEVRQDLLERSLWLVESVQQRPALMTHDVIVQSQYHVLLWGNEQGR